MQMRQQKKILAELYASNKKKQLAFLKEMQTKSNVLLPVSLVLFDQSVSENRDVGEKKPLTDNKLLSIQEPELNQIPSSRMA